MIHLRESLLRLRSYFQKAPLDRDLDQEMAAHLQFAVEDNLQRGMSAKEADRQARINFGGPQQAREKHREARSFLALDELLRNLRYTFRTLRRDRSFALIAILILALGIGANIAVFSIVNALLLRPLPFPNSEQLTWFIANHGEGGLSAVTYNVGSYEEFRRHNQSFQEVTAYQAFWGSSEFNMTGRGEPRHVQAVMVADNFFRTLGVDAALGRTFTSTECVKGGAPAAMLSNGFWRQQFGTDRSVVGQTITLDNRVVTIVGVLPASFDFPSVFSPGLHADIFIPAYMDEIRTWGNTVAIVGRLKPGVTIPQAQAEADVVFPQLKAAHPEWFMAYTADLTPLKEYVSGKLRRSLLVLWGAVALILLIVCVNLSNLLLARTASRSKEFAIRNALGAGRARLVRQFLTESFVLSGVGAVLGIGLAWAVTSYLAHQGSLLLPLLGTLRVDTSALAWTLLVTVVVAVLFGIAPGLILSGVDVQESLKDAGRGLSEGKKHHFMRSAMVVCEVSLACVLLVGAGLLLRSFLRVLDVDLGFQPSRAAALTIQYDDGDSGAKRATILRQILAQVQASPGIEAAGVTDMLPLGRNRSWGFLNPLHAYREGDDRSAIVRIITPGYLDAMGIRIVQGRDFSWQDAANTEPVVIINETAARLHWPGESPLGHLARGMGKDPARVVGVVSDVRVTSIESSPGAEMYLLTTQAAPEGSQLVVRSALPPDVLTRMIIPELRGLNPAQPATVFQPIQTIVDHSVSPRRFFVSLVTAFAVLGLILAALGIYGVISYMVTRQQQEIGIRMALGATRGNVQLGVMTRALRLALIGIAVGVVVAFAAGKWIASLLYHTEPTDPITFIAMLVIFASVAALAGYLPALRASRVDPLEALRAE